MHKWLKISAPLAALLAGGGAFYEFVIAPPATDPDPLYAQIGPTQRRAAIDDCMQAAQMVFAVHWAVACSAQAVQTPAEADGNAECDLPDSRAAVVNAWLDEAERACMADVRAGLTR